jgi:hypothetical protein
MHKISFNETPHTRALSTAHSSIVHFTSALLLTEHLPYTYAVYTQTGNTAATSTNSTTDANGISVITSSRGGLDIRASVMFPPVTLLPGSVLIGSIPRGQVNISQLLTLVVYVYVCS